MDIDDCNLGDEVIGGPVHKLLEANPAARRALAEIKHVEHGLARGSALYGLGLLLCPLSDLLGLVLDGGIAVLDKVFVTLLGILHSDNGFVLHEPLSPPPEPSASILFCIICILQLCASD